MKTFKSNSQEETIEIGQKIGNLLNPGDTVLLVGDLSAGKTTITKGIGKALGVTKIINSPTFTIVKDYIGSKCGLYHLDLYRLDGLNNDFDLEEYIESDGICAIEWPHQIDEIIPDNYLNIKLSRINDNERIIEIEGIGRYKKYEEMI